MTTNAELYQEYLNEVDNLLRKHDLPQASEKLWGAFVDAVKAVAERRNQMLGTHRSIALLVLTLEKEYPELKLHDAFRHAEALHTNFFEDQLPEESVRLSEEVVRGAIERLRSNLPF
jgi:hypothetical protein